MPHAARTTDSAPADAYAEHRTYVLNVLGRRCRWLDEDDREAVFHDAYALLLEKHREGTVNLHALHSQQVRAFLIRTAINKALDEGRRAWRKRSVALSEDDHDGNYVDQEQSPIEDVIAGATDRARLLEIIAELPERQQTIVKLRFFFDREPAEIQRFLDVTERSYRRDLERAMKQIAKRFELVVSGDFCESRRSVILALVAGVAGPNRAATARRHLETCPACASWAGELRAAVQRSAAVIPLPVVLDAHHETLRERFADGAAVLKQHVAALVLRVDPATASAAGGARPGTVAAGVAACVVACGGATYGTVAPVRSAIDGALGRQPAPHRAAADKQHEREPRAAATATPVRTPTLTPVPTATPVQAASAKPRKRERSRTRDRARRPAPREPLSAPDQAAAAQEFGLESAPPPAPPPAAPGEFDP